MRGRWAGRGDWVLAAIVLALASASGPAAAADAPATPSTVQLAAVALPVVVDNKLINYVFVTVKLDLAQGADGSAVRDKEPFFRDALVRAGHRTPFTLPTDYTKLDERRIRAEVMNDAVVILGRGVVRNVTVVKQVSQHRNDLPTPGATAAKPELVP